MCILPGVISVLPHPTWMHPWPAHERFVWVIVFLSLGLLAQCVSHYMPSTASASLLPKLTPCCMPLVCLGVAFLGSAPELPLNMSFTGGRFDKKLYQDEFMRSGYYSRLARTHQFMSAVRAGCGSSRPYLWFNLLDPLGKEFRAMAMCYGMSAVSDAFPDLKWSHAPELAVSPPPSPVVLISQDPRAFEKAQRTMQAHGRTLSMIHQQIVEDAGVRYTVTTCNVSP